MAPTEHGSIFERIRQEDEQGNEFWSGRDLSGALGYTEWRNFTRAIKKAMKSCESSGYEVSDHFVEANKMVALGSGAQREIEDYYLSRYACYLIVQNADPSKEIVALGQTYFAIQTRRQELADEAALAGMSEEQKRLYIRDQLREHNTQLAAAAQAVGVLTPMDFAVFQNHGYRGLYGGLNRQAIAARKGLTPRQEILDYMGSEELAANLFRATQAEARLRRDNQQGLQGKGHANATHFAVGQKVRQTIAELGGVMPEDLPTPAESVSQVRRRQQFLAQQAEAAARLPAQQESLFDQPGDRDNEA